MPQKDELGIVPPQYTGHEIEVTSSKKITDEQEARSAFEQAKKRLLDVNRWSTISGVIAANFDVIDEDGRKVERLIRKNDYLRVNVPGPGSKEGDGYDWVRVEEIREINEGSFQSIGFRVRPTDNPFSDKNETAHFYSAEATSSFLLARHNSEITCTIVDRNLRPNKESRSIIDKARDVIVGMSAIAGFSKVQWQGLADGLIA